MTTSWQLQGGQGRCEGTGSDSLKQVSARLLLAGMIAATAPAVFGAAEFKLSDDASVTAGLGLRTSFSKTENGAPNGTSNSNDFVIDNARLFFSGNYGKVIKGTFNTDYNSTTDSLQVLDAYVGFEFNDYFNIWLGRFLPPQDRANGYGPFYALPWTYPVIASNYPFRENGRDNGVAIWGKAAGGKFIYAGGAFEGHNKTHAGLSGASDKLAYSGRLSYAFWDPEPAPAYLTGGWFGGSKDILTVALAGYTQQDGVGTAANPGRLRVWNADVLFEKKTAAGVPTLEGAYYKYNLGVVDCGSGEPGASPACPTVGVSSSANLNLPQTDGKAYLFGAAWLFPAKVGWGQFQPFYRYQKFERSLSNTDQKWQDIGVNYIIKGPNAKVTAQYSKMEDDKPVPAGSDIWKFLIGVQVIY